MRHVALLRGINVGGNHLIKMADLKACFEGLGLKEVQTYIQSGNVVFSSPLGAASLEKKLAQGLSKAFGYDARLLVLSAPQLKAILAQAPAWLGKEPAKYRYDVIFLMRGLKAGDALKAFSLKEGVDRVAAGKGAIYFSKLTAKATQSRLGKIAGTPAYKLMTIRNWNTSSKLLSLLG